MKFKTKNKDILKSLNYMSRVAIKSNINPIFECVLIKVDNHNLIFRATNLEIILERAINIKGIMNGKVLMKIGTLQKVLQNIDGESSLDFELEGNILKVSNENNEFDFEIFSSDEDLPSIPGGDTELLKINSHNFSNNIKSVIFCASKSEIKPEISSVYMYKNSLSENVYYVATDSYRLAEKVEYVADAKDFSLILPYKNLVSILSVIDDIEGEIVISEYTDGILIKSDSINIAMRVVSGNFPDYKQLFPKEFNYKISLNKSNFQKILQISNILTTQYNFCEFNLDSVNTSITIKSKEKGIGSSKSVIKYDYIEGEMEDFVINYNSVYFYEGLTKLTGDKMIFRYTVPNKALFITSDDNLSFTYLLMPLNR